jgi:hypothetical protein
MTGLRPDSTGAWNFINYFRQKVPNATSFPQFFKNQPGYLAMGSGKLVIQPSPPSLQSPLHATTITTAFHHNHHCIPPQIPPPPGHLATATITSTTAARYQNRHCHRNHLATTTATHSLVLTSARLPLPATLIRFFPNQPPTHTRPLDHRSLAQSSTHTTPNSPCAVPHVQPSRPRRTAQLVTGAQREPNVL